jgi:hypothetical protein
MGKDCERVSVQEVGRAYYYIHDTGEVFPKWRVIWKSPDGQWYRCRYLNTSGPMAGKTKCLVAPIPST